MSWRKPIAIVTFGLAFAAAVGLHAPGLNGPWYWQWDWRQLDALRVFFALLVAAAPFALAQRWHQKKPDEASIPLLLLAASTFCLQLAGAGVQSDAFELTRLWDLVASPDSTGYFTDAWQLLGRERLLETYPDLMPEMQMHSRNKPPGPLLFHMLMLHLFGRNRAAALAGGLMIAVLAACVPVAVHGLLKVLGRSREIAFQGASCAALGTGLILFCPMLDQAYPLLTCAVIATWVVALRMETRAARLSAAAGAGLVFALACFFSYNLLVLGAFLAGTSMLHLARRGFAPEVARLLVCLGAAAGAVVMAYAALWTATGFNPFAAFAAAFRNQAEMASLLDRPYPACVPFDLLDFALGLGWAPVLLGAFLLASKDPAGEDGRWLDWLAWGQIFLVAATGLLRTETARVWLFLVPLAVLPAARELARWSPKQRACVFAVMWLLLATVCRNMTFLRVGSLVQP